MNREEKINLLKQAFTNLKTTFQRKAFLETEFDNKGASGRYDQNSRIRVLGSEPTFQLNWCLEIDRLIANQNECLACVVEVPSPIKSGGKITDILLWDTSRVSSSNITANLFWDSDTVSLVKIETKCTGSNLTQDDSITKTGNLKKYDSFFWEIERYRLDPSLSKGECLFVFSCFYESTPSSLLDIIYEHGSLLQWMRKERKQKMQVHKIELTDNFINNCIECYAFRGGATDWLFIDNRSLQGYNHGV